MGVSSNEDSFGHGGSSRTATAARCYGDGTSGVSHQRLGLRHYHHDDDQGKIDGDDDRNNGARTATEAAVRLR